MRKCEMKFGLLGEKLGHSYSPQIHAMLGDYEYSLYEVPADQLGRFLEETDLDGMNVTIPYKKAVIPHCARLSDSAERIGSVNTLVRRADGWHGYNTDYDGFRYMVCESAGYDVRGKKGVIFGNGGVSPSVRWALEDMGASEVVTVSRKGPVRYEDTQLYEDAAFAVNATPVGMYPDTDRCIQDLSVFTGPEAVFDLIYNPEYTLLLKQAQKRGLTAENGLSMLVAQAVRASEIFTGRKIEDTRIAEVTAAIAEEMYA